MIHGNPPISIAQKMHAMRTVLDALIAAVAKCEPDGVPAGTLYAALMAQGCDLATFERLMGMLVEAKRLVKNGHIYRIAPDHRKGSS